MSTITVRTLADVKTAEREHPDATLKFDTRVTQPDSGIGIRAREFLEKYGNSRVTDNIEAFLGELLTKIDDAYFEGESETYELNTRYSRTGRPEIFYA